MSSVVTDDATTGNSSTAQDLVTSETTTGLAGPASSTYTYDEAGRLTSWDNGTATTQYGYDGNGNLTRDGSKTYTYDARDELTSDGTSTYTYTARGTAASESSPSGSVAVSFDAYGDQASAGTRSYAYDALGRLTADTPTAGGSGYQFSYAGKTGTVASDGTSAYAWDPSGSVLAGVGAPGGGTGGVLALTDAHGDVLGQFTAAGTTVNGSQAYDPWGTVTATTGTMTGMLGFQSAWTDPASGKDLMGARWYNPAAGDFTSADTVQVPPVPDPAAASPFGYAAGNPLSFTDPTGHRTVDLPTDDATDPEAAAALIAAAQAYAVLPNPARAAYLQAATKAENTAEARQRALEARHRAAAAQAAKKRAQQKAEDALKPKDKPGSKGPKRPSNNPSCPSGAVDPLECWNMNFLFEKDSSTSAGDVSDGSLSELPCLTGEGFVTIRGCGTLNAAASDKEDSSRDGSSSPGASSDDPGGLPNLPNLAKKIGEEKQATEDEGLDADPEFVREVAASIADHIAGRHILAGVPEGSEASYIEDVILDPSPQVRTKMVDPLTGEQIWQDGRNIVIYQPMAPEGGTAFAKPTADSATYYFDNFGS